MVEFSALRVLVGREWLLFRLVRLLGSPFEREFKILVVLLKDEEGVENDSVFYFLVEEAPFGDLVLVDQIN